MDRGRAGAEEAVHGVRGEVTGGDGQDVAELLEVAEALDGGGRVDLGLVGVRAGFAEEPVASMVMNGNV